MKVLIVDDEQANRLILQAMLKKGDHVVIEACNGQEAVDLFDEHHPDLVLMDVMMPVMDGYDAARRIKDKSSKYFVPIIFLTAITDEDALVKCVESGGDDFLTKPYNRTILQAKIAAMERIRLLHRTVTVQNQELEEYHRYIEREQEVAEKIFSKLMQQGEGDLPMINTYRKSAATFNGDIFLVSRQPSGVVYLLAGDFTGHGLAAAIGALPATQIFYAMSNKGFAVQDIIVEINQRLKSLLPTGMFLAASLIQLDPAKSMATIWHGGLPDIFVVSGKDGSISTIKSQHLPLGVVNKDSLEYEPDIVPIGKNDRFIIYSDGLIESFDSAGRIYGTDRLEAIIKNKRDNEQDYIAEIIEDLNGFMGDEVPHDDITLVEFVCDDEFFNVDVKIGKEDPVHSPKDWELTFVFKHDLLGNLDPVPILMSAIRDIQGLQKYKEDIFLILSELYVNALDYGVLHMESSLKMEEGGFEKYYSEREKRLTKLKDGWIKIILADKKKDDKGCLSIVVEDSGKGFDHKQSSMKTSASKIRHGRGLALINNLASSFKYNAAGNRAEVLYEWC